MECSRCGEECRCTQASADAHVSVLIDPESFSDDSEQAFAASLNTAAAAEDDVLGIEEPPAPAATVVTSAFASEPPVMAAQAERGAAPEFYRPPVWKDEVASRVEAYQRKRGRRRYDPNSSLSLDFEPLAEEPEPPPPPRYAALRVEPAEKPKVIEFPRPQTLELPLADELAEPVVETPRILDVPESAPVVAEQPLAGIELEAPPAVAAAGTPEDYPLPVAPMGPRIAAGLVDMLVVLTAAAVFGIIFMMIAQEMPQGRALLAGALLLPGLLWVVYHYMFLVHAGTTPGMQTAQLGLAHFRDDQPVGRRHRRFRALAMCVSAMSLWLGFLWAFLDEDRLTWHDRISHTFLVNE